jgi:hypothetical protein
MEEGVGLETKVKQTRKGRRGYLSKDQSKAR